MILPFLTWLADNILYHIFILIVFFVWDSIDFYMQTQKYSFFLKRSYLLYFCTRAFLSIVVMELTISLGLFNAQNKVAISFITPLIFTTMIQNLVVILGGKTHLHFDMAELFDKFRYRVVESFLHDEITRKVALSTKISKSMLPTSEIEKACQIYAPSIKAFNTLRDWISEYPEERRRVDYTKELIEWMGIEFVEELFKDSLGEQMKRSRRTNERRKARKVS